MKKSKVRREETFGEERRGESKRERRRRKEGRGRGREMAIGR